MKIGFDFDGVISRLPLSKAFKIAASNIETILKRAMIHAVLIPEAVDAIQELQKRGHEVVIITARSKSMAEVTHNWLKRHGIGHLSKLITFNGGKNYEARWVRNYKVRAIGRQRVQLYIEDTPDIAEAIARRTKAEVILHRGDWGETWQDIMAVIREKKGKRKNPSDIIGFDIDGVLTVTMPDHRERIAKEGNTYRHWIQRHGPANEEMLRFVRRMVNEGNQVYFITGRVGADALERTKEWFNDHGLNDLNNRIYANLKKVDYRNIEFDIAHKVETIKKLGVDTYYEDNLEIALELMQKTPAYIVRYTRPQLNPHPRIILSVPHAVGMVKEGREIGHDYIAKEMALKLAVKLHVEPENLVVGDIPRDIMDLNRERNRWKTDFRTKVRNLIKRDPSNAVHLDVHSFRFNSKVYAGNDIAIATTEKTPRPYEIELMAFLTAHGLKVKIYTEMLMDVVPEVRELGAPFSVLIEFNEGVTPEQKEQYTDLVAQFILQRFGTANPQWCYRCGMKIEEGDDWVYETTSSTYGEEGVRVRHKDCRINPEDVETLVPIDLGLTPSKIIKGNISKSGVVKSWKTDAGGRPYHEDMLPSSIEYIHFTIDDYSVTLSYPMGRDFKPGTLDFNRVVKDLKKIVDAPQYYKGLYVEHGPTEHTFPSIEAFLKGKTLEAIPVAENPDTPLRRPTAREMEHERERVDSMTNRQLRTRLGRMTIPQKIYAFAQALTPYPEISRLAWTKLLQLGYTQDGEPVRVDVLPEPEEGPDYEGAQIEDVVVRDEDIGEAWNNTHIPELNSMIKLVGSLIPRAITEYAWDDRTPVMRTKIKQVFHDGLIRKVVAPGSTFLEIVWEKVLAKYGVLPDSTRKYLLYHPIHQSEVSSEGPGGRFTLDIRTHQELIFSTTPLIGLKEEYSDGWVAEMLVTLSEDPHEVILATPTELVLRVADIVSYNIRDAFDVRSAMGIVANPECVLCSDLQTPHIYYEDEFILICEDLDKKGSILGMVKKHTTDPPNWEREWLLRTMNVIAGDLFHHKFDIVETTNVMEHCFIRAVGNLHIL